MAKVTSTCTNIMIPVERSLMCNSKFNFKEIGQMSRSKGLKPTERSYITGYTHIKCQVLALTVEEIYH